MQRGLWKPTGQAINDGRRQLRRAARWGEPPDVKHLSLIRSVARSNG